MFNNPFLIVIMCISLFISLMAYGIYASRAEEDVNKFFSFLIPAIVFGVSFYLLLNFSPFSDEIKKAGKGNSKTELHSKHSSATTQLRDLKRNSDKWLNSYDDEKFSTSELYSLRTLQKLTGVKVYDNALAIQKVYNQENLKKLKESLFEARDSLEADYVIHADESSI